VVSVNSVQITENQKYVFVLMGTKVTHRTVEIGADLDDSQFFEVTQGLAGGEEVVIAGADGLSEGSAVRATREVDPYSGARAAAPSAAPSASTNGPVRN
jgi:hypothetical protein